MSTSVPPPPTGAPSRRRGFGLLAIAVAVVAVVLALASSVLAWRASTRAGDAVDRIEALEKARPGPPAAPATAPPVAGEPTTDPGEPPDPANSSVPVLNAQTQYTVRYADKRLTIAPSCAQNVYLDLDEPRVQVDQNVAELRYYDPCGADAASFRMQAGIDGTKVSSANVTPTECADQIGVSPLLHDQAIPVHRGDVLCLTTSLDSARASGVTWKMVLVSVEATAQDGTVSLKASAWDIPIR